MTNSTATASEVDMETIMTRAELAAWAHLSPRTITTIAREMEAEGYKHVWRGANYLRIGVSDFTEYMASRKRKQHTYILNSTRRGRDK